MAKERGYFLTIVEKGSGEETEAFIRSALNHEEIACWAYILHDKDCYNEHDMKSRYYGLQRSWADGFGGMEKYASKQEYIDEQMKAPPFVGDPRPKVWLILCIADPKKCGTDDIAEWFGIQEPLVDLFINRAQIVPRLKTLTQEDHFSRAFERYLYPDEDVKANFDFREYIDSTKEHQRWEKFKDIFRPAPKRKRGR